jgi:hypothetical protein
MGVRSWRQLLIAVIACGALVSPAPADAQGQRGRSVRPGWDTQNQNRYEQGYRQGLREGERDARTGEPFGGRRSAGLLGGGRDAQRLGFADGYRAGYQRVPVQTIQRGRGGARANGNLVLRSRLGGDAYATGYDRGYEKGIEDGRDGDRYDPVRHRNYRDGDEGYSGDDGSRDAYKNNYRAGFRQGYEEGYRQGALNRR